MSDVEEKLIKIYNGSKPVEEDLFEVGYINQLAWTLVVVLAGVVIWLSIALINAENQRNALITRQCADPVFTGETDRKCLQFVASREYWWQHLWYGVTHLRPEQQK